MKRRDFIGKAGIGLATGVVAASPGKSPEEKLKKLLL